MKSPTLHSVLVLLWFVCSSALLGCGAGSGSGSDSGSDLLVDSTSDSSDSVTVELVQSKILVSSPDNTGTVALVGLTGAAPANQKLLVANNTDSSQLASLTTGPGGSFAVLLKPRSATMLALQLAGDTSGITLALPQTQTGLSTPLTALISTSISTTAGLRIDGLLGAITPQHSAVLANIATGQVVQTTGGNLGDFSSLLNGSPGDDLVLFVLDPTGAPNSIFVTLAASNAEFPVVVAPVPPTGGPAAALTPDGVLQPSSTVEVTRSGSSLATISANSDGGFGHCFDLLSAADLLLFSGKNNQGADVTASRTVESTDVPGQTLSNYLANELNGVLQISGNVTLTGGFLVLINCEKQRWTSAEIKADGSFSLSIQGQAGDRGGWFTIDPDGKISPLAIIGDLIGINPRPIPDLTAIVASDIDELDRILLVGYGTDSPISNKPGVLPGIPTGAAVVPNSTVTLKLNGKTLTAPATDTGGFALIIPDVSPGDQLTISFALDGDESDSATLTIPTPGSTPEPDLTRITAFVDTPEPLLSGIDGSVPKDSTLIVANLATGRVRLKHNLLSVDTTFSMAIPGQVGDTLALFVQNSGVAGPFNQLNIAARTLAEKDDQSICLVAAAKRLGFYSCAWNGDAAFCVNYLSDKTTFEPAGSTCCVANLETTVAPTSSTFDLSLDLPQFSFVQALFPLHEGGKRQFVNHVHEGGGSLPKLNLSLWRETTTSCVFEKSPITAFTNDNDDFVDPIAQGVGQSVYGVYLEPGASELRSVSIDPTALTPTWSAPATVLQSCKPDRFYPCETTNGAKYRAFVVDCGGTPTLLRSSDGKAFQSIALPINGFNSTTLSDGAFKCLTTGEKLYLAWSVFAAGTESWFFNVWSDDLGDWDKLQFATSPTIKSAAVSGPAQRLKLTRFKVSTNHFWAAFMQRTGTGEPGGGTRISFGRSANGTDWTFFDDTSDCQGTRCMVADFVIIGDGYLYIKTITGTVDATKMRAEFLFNVDDGDPLKPTRLPTVLTDLLDEGEQSGLSLALSGKMVGLLYWVGRDINTTINDKAELRLLRIELLD